MELPLPPDIGTAVEDPVDAVSEHKIMKFSATQMHSSVLHLATNGVLNSMGQLLSPNNLVVETGKQAAAENASK